MTCECLEQKKVWGGSQYRYQHTSTTLGCDMVFSLYLPPQAQLGPVPLIWWLSGLTCDDQNFSTKAAFQQKAAQLGAAVVIPDTSPRGEDVPDAESYDLGQGAGFYLNATAEPWAKNYQMYDYLTEELPALVDDLLPAGKTSESIMGHSMGGYGALLLGLKNPERFTAISAFAPISQPTTVPWGQQVFRAYLGNEEADWAAWDPVALAKTLKEAPPLLITQGTADEFLDEHLAAGEFLTACQKQHLPVTYHLEAGYDHSYYTIQSFIPEHLRFHAKTFK